MTTSTGDPFAVPRIEAEHRPDGRLLLRSTEPLGRHPVAVLAADPPPPQVVVRA